MTDRDSSNHNSSGSSCRGSSRRRHSRHRWRGRKERVLHTRISEQLSDDIRRLADDMRVPVSNLVRNVLEEVFTAVENVSGDVGEFFEDVLDEAEGVRERIRNRRWDGRASAGSDRSRKRSTAEDVEGEFRDDEAAEVSTQKSRSRESKPAEPEDDVLGWQSIVLNRALDCPGCGVKMTSGDTAHIGISASGKPGRVVCSSCAAAN